MINQLPTEDDLTQMLEEDGLPTFDAREAAQEIIKSNAAMMPGVTFGGVDLAEIPELVTRATRAGVSRLTLEISCEPQKQHNWHHFTVKVLNTQRWGE
jgi:hypothetical protein